MILTLLQDGNIPNRVTCCPALLNVLLHTRMHTCMRTSHIHTWQGYLLSHFTYTCTTTYSHTCIAYMAIYLCTSAPTTVHRYGPSTYVSTYLRLPTYLRMPMHISTGTHVRTFIHVCMYVCVNACT